MAGEAEYLRSLINGQRNHVVASATFTPTAVPYGAADIMGAAAQMQFTDRNGIAVPAGSLIRVLATLTKIDVTAVPAGQTSYTLHCYQVTPPSAQADNDLWALASADLASYQGSLALGSPVDLGASLFVRAAVDVLLKLTTDSVFARLVTDGAHTPAAVARTINLIGLAL